MGIVEGYPDRTFRPHADVTRAEAAKMAYLIWELEILEDMAKLFGDDNEES